MDRKLVVDDSCCLLRSVRRFVESGIGELVDVGVGIGVVVDDYSV